MAGLVKAGEGLAGNLLKALHSIQNMDARSLKQIGQVFSDSSELNPSYFTTGRDLPKGVSPQEAVRYLNAKHGSDLREVGTMGRIEGLGGRANMDIEGPLGQSYELLRAGLLKRPRAGVGPSTDVHTIDTMSVGKGEGAKDLYPAFWEYVLSRPDAANAATALSASNGFRRSANMAPFYEKHGEAANRIIAHPDQFSATGGQETLRNVSDFHKLPVEGQIGALNAIVAQQSGGEVGRLMQQALKGSRGDAPERYNQYLRQARELKLDPEAPYQPSTDVDPTHFRDLASLLRQIGNTTGEPPLVGESSLRRAAITSDALEGLTAKDLANQPWLTDRLGRRQGGRIPAAGPLSIPWR